MRLAAVALLAGCGRVDFAPSRDGAAGPADIGPADDTALLTYRAAVLADHPLAYWRMADLGATAHDEMGSFDGTYAGTCQPGVAGALAGDPDPAVAFDGTSCCVTIGDVLSFTGTAPFSLEAWVQHVNNAGEPFQMIVSRESRSSGPIDGYALVDGRDAPSGLYAERAIAATNDLTAHDPFPDATYVHVVSAYDGAMLRLYTNGALVQTAPDARAMPTFSAITRLGCQPDMTGQYFTGTIDEVAIYDQALDPARIALHHDIGVSGPR